MTSCIRNHVLSTVAEKEVLALTIGGQENGKAEGDDDEMADGDKEDPLPDEQYGYPKTESSKWASCIRVLDPKTATTSCLLELQDNEAAFSLCAVNFHDNKELGTLLAVGTAKDLQFMPKKESSGGFIHIYRFAEEGKALELVHKTPVDGVPTALCQFQGRLLVGVGQVLRIYDLGKRKLLRKCENKNFPNTIIAIHTYGDRIYVGDIQEVHSPLPTFFSQ
jgi:splicing factor 3B subunit 3